MKKLLLLFPFVSCALLALSQNVGIGTNTPDYKLHVNGGDIFVQSSSGAYRFGYNGGNQWRFPTTGGGAHFRMSVSTDGNAFTPLHYFDQNGDVGIGVGAIVSNPQARLEVRSASSSAINSAFMVRNSDGDTLVRVRDNGYVGIGFNGPSYGRPLNVQGNGINLYSNANDFGGAIFPQATGNIVMWSDNSSTGKVVLQPSWGQVTIGTYTGANGYKLSVNGKVIMEEARVQLSTAWPDYVFAKNYKLPSLNDLETYIRKNNHLPNIPSAAEVEKQKGFDLGDMQTRLLEKIEELTLYVIELKKENGELNHRLKKLEKH